jgi:hypothetical protein
MKKLILIFILLTGSLFFEATFAQVKTKDNIESQPMWGPVGYAYVDYYYLPDIETYYYIKKHKFVYFEDGFWISRYALPEKYNGYDVYNGRVIVINEPRPYLRHKDHWAKYPWTNEGKNQQIIRDSQEIKYMINKNHPGHSKWVEMKKNERRNKWKS